MDAVRGRNKKKKHYRQPQEMLTAYDDNINEIGTFARSVVHYNKMWHKVVQCWIVRETDEGIYIYLQRRSFEKKSNPGRYDVTSGGHVSAGEEPEQAIIREMKEEAGIDLISEKLEHVGVFREVSGNDREIAYIYVYFVDSDPQFAPGEEVIYMVAAKLEDFKLLSAGECSEITVIPAIRTGPIYDESFMVNQGNFCNHRSFIELVYPYIKKRIN